MGKLRDKNIGHMENTTKWQNYVLYQQLDINGLNSPIEKAKD
jgi:hypothetical protein